MPAKVLFVIIFVEEGQINLSIYCQELGPLPFVRDAEHLLINDTVPGNLLFSALHETIARGHSVFVDSTGQELPWDQHIPFLIPQLGPET